MGQKYRVIPGYVVLLKDGRTLGAGEIFEPDGEILAKQGWKLAPYEPAPPPGPKAQAGPPEAPTQDRAVKAQQVKKK